jgi:uncharacterized protein YjbI with pentapeptide repeats
LLLFVDEVRYVMSEQNGTHVSTKPRRNRQASTIKITLQRPANDDKEAWEAYWESLGQPWRTEPEIDIERQMYLAKQRNIEPDLAQLIFPFDGISLNRADVEWLLATHENGRGPVIWIDKSQREREGLDLRGADLRGANLSGLPLACLYCGLNGEDILNLIEPSEALEGIAPVHLEKAILKDAHLEGANFYCAHLEEVDLSGANLEGAMLSGAHLDLANLNSVYLKGALLGDTFLKGTSLVGAHLEDASLRGAFLIRTNLRHVFLGNTDLRYATWIDKNGVGPHLLNVHWGDTDLGVVKWSQIKVLGDEDRALDDEFKGKDWLLRERIDCNEEAVRSYRQLSVTLRNQGLNEDAARFAYRSQLMKRKVYLLQRNFLSFLGSLFLDLLSGYGYKPLRCFIAYLIVILSFALAYFIIGHTVGPVLSPLGSVVFSMTSFHGRGFFPGGIGLDDPLTVVAALEAFIGLLIEVTFIATLTQRLFGK